MGLQVWLPLTKDLRNQGLDNVTVTNNGAAFNSAGKLGGCYTFNGSSNYLTIPQGYIGTNWSYTTWVYTTSTSATQTLGCCRTAVGTGFSAFLISGKLRIDPGANNIQWTTNYTFPVNTWFHVAITCNNGVIKYYIDGQYQQSYSTTLASNQWGTVFSIGASQSNGSSYGNYLNGKLNDVRIYDHCLSPMEVKELSKGLVLHYPLNRQGWGQENLVWNSNWFLHSTVSPENWTNWGSPPTREIVTINNKNWLHVISNTTTFQGYSQNWTKRNGVGELTANQKVTISFTAYLAAAATIAPIGIHWNNSSGTIVSQNWTTTALTTSPKRYGFTYTTPSDCVAFNIMVGDNTNTAHEIWITDIKLELGEVATPWCPNSSDTLATTMGLNSTTEYDCSGFGNNGTRTGTFTWTSDTPKYSVSTNFDATQRIEIPFNPGNSPTFTVAGWFYHTGGTSYYGAKNNYNTYICLEGSRYFVYNSSGSAYVGYWTSTVNTWQHVVLVHDAPATKLKLYVNGNFVSEVTTNGTIYGSDILDLGGRQESAQYSGKMSDFRIYATALSTDDIQSLYQNSAYIDSSGNVYGAVHSEV